MIQRNNVPLYTGSMKVEEQNGRFLLPWYFNIHFPSPSKFLYVLNIRNKHVAYGLERDKETEEGG